MDFAVFKAQLDAGRRVEHAVDGVTFQMTLPTQYQSRVTFEDHRDELGRVRYTRSLCDLVKNAITGWSGLTARHFDGGAVTDAVPFSPEARDTLIEIRQDMCDELGVFVSARIKERNQQLEDSAKNS